jgi:hypothetical protein
MLVSLFSYSQYPTVKTIGNEQVVIMTLKQGEEINKKFSSLSDSIKILNESISEKIYKLNISDIQKARLDSLLSEKNKTIVMTEEELKRLKKILEDSDKSHWREKRQWGLWMFVSFIVTVIGFSL